MTNKIIHSFINLLKLKEILNTFREFKEDIFQSFRFHCYFFIT